MNLSKTLKKQLIEDVIKDQFGERNDSLIKSLKQVAAAILVRKEKGLYETLVQKCKEHGIPPISALKYNVRYVLNEEREPRSGWDTDTKFLGRTPAGLKAFDEYVDTPPLIIDVKGLLISDHPKLNELYTRLALLRKNAREMQDDLTAVLDTVRTVKKLQELTDVFDPFIPASAKSNALVPAEVICRVNEIKTPKTKQKIAA